MQKRNQYIYKTKECLIEHQKFFHTTKYKNNEYVKDTEYRMNYKKKTILARVQKLKQNILINLHSCRTKTAPGKVMYINDRGEIYKVDLIFREKNSRRKRKEDILEK